ncbi:MAG: iron-containing alcohol dehydrogenase [Proteobacteria bacterium]|nr:iron-containing alcohol dehydrogenase [Pseudomonadota bacterium]
MNWTGRYGYNFPTSIRFGAGVIEELPEYLKTQNWKRPLIVSDKAVVQLGFFKKILASLESAGISPAVYSGISKNPVESDVLAGVQHFQNEKCDGVIGLGGGASLDVARAIVLKAFHSRPLFDYDDALGGDKYVTEKIPPFVTVPTTSGTGSEVGRSTVIAENETHKKRILFSPRLIANKVFADPALTFDLPAGVTAATGMDALTHNVEAFLSKGVSPLCDGIAVEAIRLISESIETATKKPADLEARAKMMIASLMGATAFQKGLGIIHSMAHPLSTVFDTHHGLANAVMMPYGLDFNKEVSADRYKYLEKIIGTSNFVQWVRELNGKLSIPATLSELKLDSAKIPQLAELALADGCHQCNPRTVTKADFEMLYKKAFQV